MMGKRKRPESSGLPPVPERGPRSGSADTAQHRLRVAELDRRERALLALESRVEAKLQALSDQIRDANSLIKASQAERDRAEKALGQLKNAVRFIAEGEVAEILKEEVEKGLASMSAAVRQSQQEAVEQVIANFDRLRDVLMGVTDPKGRPKRDRPNLEEIVAGIAIERLSSDDPPKGFGG